MNTTLHRRTWRSLPWLAALLMLWAATAAFAQDAIDPPGRVGHLSYRSGGVVFAPHGEDEWTELPQNRPLTSGDRLWTDRGARAEMHVGSATLHIAGESHVGVSTLDDNATQLILQQGSLSTRVRDLQQGENFEIGTPNLAFRALQPGEFRLDVEADGQTRVTVLSGTAAVFGERGESVNLGAGQQATFAGRSLARVQGGSYRQDDFGQWAAERNRAEDQSVSARHVPRAVVGYAQLDQYGTWDAHPQYGSVWYPQSTPQDWAPYRNGHWTHVQPWGWTWVDDAPWGFAPFHYGRWTQIGPRWAWVPGQLAARPVYSPALVVFMGNGGTSVSISSGSPSVGWYPLGPGEAWWPVYRTSPRYVTYVNYNINIQSQPREAWRHHWWRQRQYAVTSVSDDDFRRGRPVYRHWRAVQPHVVNQWQSGWVPSRPDRRQWREYGQARPRLQTLPPTVLPGLPVRIGGRDRDNDRDWRNRDRDNDRAGNDARGRDRDGVQGRGNDRDGRRDNDRDGRDGRDGRGRDQANLPPLVREQQRAVREQDRLQHDAGRAARDQVRAAEQARRDQDVRAQRERLMREQQQSARQQEQAARQQEQQGSRQRAEAAQQRQQEREAAVQRQHDQRAQREAAVQRQQEREAARQRVDPAARDQQEQRQRAWQQQQQRQVDVQQRQAEQRQRVEQREQRQQQREAVQEQRQQDRGNRGADRGGERGGDNRGQGRWQREANDGQGQGRGQRG